MKGSTKPKTKAALLLIVSIILTGLSLNGCVGNAGSSGTLTRSGFYFDTLINITLYDCNDPAILDSCFDLCSEYENLLSVSVSGS